MSGTIGSLFRRPRPELLWLLLLGGLLRLAAVWIVRETRMAGDEGDYFARAGMVLESGRLLDDGLRAPLFEAFLALLSALVGHGLLALRMVCALLSTGLILALHALGTRIGGRRTGALAAALAAVYPPFIAFGHYLWAESLYTLMAAVALLLLESGLRLDERRRLVAGGVVLALMVLTREVAVGVVLTLAVGLLVLPSDAKTRLWRSAALLAPVLVLVLAWSLHLNRSKGPDDPPALVTRTTYMNLYVGNGVPAQVRAEHPGLTPYDHYQSLGSSALERERNVRPFVWQSIREQQPGWLFAKTGKELVRFFAPGDLTVRRLLVVDDQPHNPWAYRGAGGQTFARGLRRALAFLIVYGTAGLLTLGIVGWVLGFQGSNPAHVLLSAFAFGHVWPTILTFGATRFRFPTMLLFVLGTAWLLAHLWERRSAPSRTRWWLAIGSGVGMAWLISQRWSWAFTSGWL